MKLTLPSRSEKGSAVLVILVLLAIMLVYIVSNAVSLHVLNRELQLIEQTQINRIHNPDSSNP